MTRTREAIQAVPEGTLLDVEVLAGASEDRFPAGYDSWRRRWRARVAAPATEGRANEALLALVARFFAVPVSRVRLVAGAADRRKSLLLEGLDARLVQDRLAGAP